MNIKYQVGDVVVVRDDLEDGVIYPNDNEEYAMCYFVESMEQYRGRSVTITQVLDGDYGAHRYHISADRGAHAWTEGMFYSPDVSCQVETADLSDIFC